VKTVHATNYNDADTYIRENLPWILNGTVEFVIDEPKADWDLYIPRFVRAAKMDNRDPGGIPIRGDVSDRAIGSLMASGAGGRFSLIAENLQFHKASPHNDEGTFCSASYSTEIELRNCSVADTGDHEKGVVAYGPNAAISLNGVDFGNNAIPSNGVDVKHGGFVFEEKTTAARDTTAAAMGNVGGYAYAATTGRIYYDSHNSTLTGDAGNVLTSGIVGDYVDYGYGGDQDPFTRNYGGKFEKLQSRSGYGNVTGSRSPDNWYTNAQDSDLDVSIVVIANADSTKVDVRLNVDPDGNTRRVDQFRQTVNSNDLATLSATVPNGYQYRLDTFGDTSDYSIERWWEQS